MYVTPEKRLLEAIIKQAIKDYLKLNPNNHALSAEFCETEAKDYITAEMFLFHDALFEYGDWRLNLEDCCLILDVESSDVKKYIIQKKQSI